MGRTKKTHQQKQNRKGRKQQVGKVQKAKQRVNTKIPVQQRGLTSKTQVLKDLKTKGEKKSAPVTAVLEDTVMFDRELTTYMKDLVFMRPFTVLFIENNGDVQLVNFEKGFNVMDQLKFDTGTRLSKLDKNTVIFTHGEKVEYVQVTEKLKRVKSIELKYKYRILKTFDQNTLIGVRPEQMRVDIVELLNTDGTILKNIRPRILKDSNLQLVSNICVDDSRDIVVGDVGNQAYVSFDASGKGGFIYTGGTDDPRSSYSEVDIASDEFTNTKYYLRQPTCVVADWRGNYIATQGNFLVRDNNVVFMMDKNGQFVQNLLYFGGHGNLCLCLDDEGKLLVGHGKGVIKIFNLNYAK